MNNANRKHASQDLLKRMFDAAIASAQPALSNSEDHGFLRTLGDSVVTGPTLNNVNDVRAILVEADHRAICGAART